MAYANADLYAPDDAARDASGKIIRTNTSVNAFVEEHPGVFGTRAALNPLIGLGILALFAYWWSRRRG